jgi:hypothetical protein
MTVDANQPASRRRRPRFLIGTVVVLATTCIALGTALIIKIESSRAIQSPVTTLPSTRPTASVFSAGYETNYATVVGFGQATVQIWTKNTGTTTGSPSCEVILTFVRSQTTTLSSNFVASAVFSLPPIEPGHTATYKGLVQGSDSNILLQPLCLNGACQNVQLTIPTASFVACKS